MKKCKVLVLQENYEYYECDEQGQPTGDMVDHNYDAPYRYVVYDTENENYLEEYDTYERAKDCVGRYEQDGTYDLDYADDVKMWELIKFSAMADEWQPQGIYFEDRLRGDVFARGLNNKRGE